MEDKTKVNEEHIDIEAFNQGYEVAKELGLKPDALQGINAGSNGSSQKVVEFSN